MDKLLKRVDNYGFHGTVRFYGKLMHKPEKGKVNPDDIWIGVEWDDETRGTHNGHIANITYFDTFDGKARGTLVRERLLDFGVEFAEAWVLKYLNAQDIKNLRENKVSLLEFLEDLAKNAGPVSRENKVEFDEEAIVHTSKHFKRIEFLGFDKVWAHIRHVKQLQAISLCDARVNSFGRSGFLTSLFPRLVELSLERNLLNTWEQVF